MTNLPSSPGYDTLINTGVKLQTNITFTPIQFMELREAIFHQFMIFGYIAATIGFLIGLYVGWSWCRRKYGSQ